MKRVSSDHVAVVGAGPAGLMAAITATRKGGRVTVYECMEQPALKLLASGGGRCNLTNRVALNEFMQAFGRQGRFIKPALDGLSPIDLCEFFDHLGVETFSRDGRHVFPCSEAAQDVCQALLNECFRLKIRIQTGCPVEELMVQDHRITGIRVADEVVLCSRVIVATGGKGYPRLGDGGAGYPLLATLGHTITPLLPANVPLRTSEAWCTELAGVSIPRVNVRIIGKGFPTKGWSGDLLFTHQGISGPVILDMSGFVSEQLRLTDQAELHVNFLASHPINGKEQFVQWRAKHGSKKISRLLSLCIPASLAVKLCMLAEVPDGCAIASLSASTQANLIRYLTACPLTIPETLGFDKAMVTRGGVSLKEIDPHTLQSRKVHGLYVAGEVLDLDAPCGGFNLQWAFSSGFLAGKQDKESSQFC